MPNYEFSDSQVTWLRVLYSLAILAFLLQAIFLVHNTWRYLYKEKLGSWLVNAFYILAILNSVAHFFYFSFLLYKPTGSPFLFDTKGIYPTEIFEWIGSTSMTAIGWLIATTMYHLHMQIRVIFSLIDENVATKRKKRVTIGAVVFVCLQFAFLAIIPSVFNRERTSEVVSYTFLFFYGTLSGSYIVIIYQLSRTLKQLDEFGNF